MSIEASMEAWKGSPGARILAGEAAACGEAGVEEGEESAVASMDGMCGEELAARLRLPGDAPGVSSEASMEAWSRRFSEASGRARSRCTSSISSCMRVWGWPLGECVCASVCVCVCVCVRVYG